MNQNSQQILFRGGSSLSVLPLVTFIIVTILLVMNGAPAVKGMIIAAMLGISIGMIFARNFAEYSEQVFSLMVNRIATVAIVAGSGQAHSLESFLTLLLITTIGIMEAGGFLEQMIDWLDRVVACSLRGAEMAIIALITFTNVCVSVNTVAMITAGPLANVLRKRHEIHPYRSANLLDTISCSFPYILPYAAPLAAAIAIQCQIVEHYNFAVVLTWEQLAPFTFYGIVLFPLMIVAAVTGFGRAKG